MNRESKPTSNALTKKLKNIIRVAEKLKDTDATKSDNLAILKPFFEKGSEIIEQYLVSYIDQLPPRQLGEPNLLISNLNYIANFYEEHSRTVERKMSKYPNERFYCSMKKIQTMCSNQEGSNFYKTFLQLNTLLLDSYIRPYCDADYAEMTDYILSEKIRTSLARKDYKEIESIKLLMKISDDMCLLSEDKQVKNIPDIQSEFLKIHVKYQVLDSLFHDGLTSLSRPLLPKKGLSQFEQSERSLASFLKTTKELSKIERHLKAITNDITQLKNKITQSNEPPAEAITPDNFSPAQTKPIEKETPASNELPALTQRLNEFSVDLTTKQQAVKTPIVMAKESADDGAILSFISSTDMSPLSSNKIQKTFVTKTSETTTFTPLLKKTQNTTADKKSNLIPSDAAPMISDNTPYHITKRGRQTLDRIIEKNPKIKLAHLCNFFLSLDGKITNGTGSRRKLEIDGRSLCLHQRHGRDNHQYVDPNTVKELRSFFMDLGLLVPYMQAKTSQHKKVRPKT